jgi:Holliday junction resolvase RusA-like endonuclease
MSIIVASIPLRPHSKPRGALGRNRQMTHSIGSYRPWQRDFLAILSEINFKVPSGFYGMLFQFNIKKKGGQQPDISNMQGGIEDVLVKGEYIKDDNWTILRHISSWAIQVKTDPSMVIYVVQTKREFLYVYDKFSD